MIPYSTHALPGIWEDDQGKIHKTFIRAYPAAQCSVVTPENFMDFPASGMD